MMGRVERKNHLIRVLAEYLGTNTAMKSAELQLKMPAAEEWAKLYNAAGVVGWQNPEEIEQVLLELLG